MKRVFLTFALILTLTAPLAACTAKPADTNGTTAQDSTANSRTRTGMNNGSTMRRDARYYADGNGRVSDWGADMGNGIRRAADDVMDGVGNAVNDMTH